MRSSGLQKFKLFEMRIKTWNFGTTIYGVRSIAFLTSLSAHCALYLLIIIIVVIIIILDHCYISGTFHGRGALFL